MKLLIIEDDKIKLNRITNFFKETYYEYSINEAHSINSALKKIVSDDYEYIVLDMTLPEFDEYDRGIRGNLLSFGGYEIMNYIDFYEIDCKVIIVTMFDVFDDNEGRRMQLQDLEIDLRTSFPRFFLGVIFYNEDSDEWSRKLLDLI